MPVFFLGATLIGVGLLSIWDANRISTTIRPRGTLDLVGPDRYMQGLAVVLILLGLGLLFKSVRDKGQEQASHKPVAVQQTLHWVLIAILIAYTLALTVLGYPLATLVAFVALFWAMGIRRWTVNGLASLAATAMFYVLFVTVAGIDFPKGMLGLG